jgi:hypothetical protein
MAGLAIWLLINRKTGLPKLKATRRRMPPPCGAWSRNIADQWIRPPNQAMKARNWSG